MAIPIRITVRKLLPMRSAIEAGRTIMVDTKRAPAAGIIRAMATPVTILKAMDMVRTGRPSTKAVSSSKVRIYMGLRNKTVRIRITAAITKRLRTCSWLMVTMEPKRYCSKLTPLRPPARLMIIRETASPVDIKMAVPISMKFL